MSFFEYLFWLLVSILTILRNFLKILTAGTFGIQPVIFPKALIHNTLTAGSSRTLV
jgi:hypothetical protein